MDYHIEHGLRLNQDPEHSGLYRWAINEVDAKGQVIGRDQIPWPWSFIFVAQTCEVVASTEIKTVYLMQKPLAAPEVADRRVIQATLRPGVFGDEDDPLRTRTRFSMFGTDRTVNDFSLRILPLSGEGPESCTAWGSVSYSHEDGDFRQRTEPDMIVFTMMVKPDTFARYAALVAQGAASGLTLRVFSVHGFYSEWSPTISTSAVKVLARSGEQPILPEVDGIDPPRLGEIGEAQVSLSRRLIFQKEATANPDDQAEGQTLESAQPQIWSAADPRLLKALTSLKRALWLVLAMLAAHFLIAIGR